VKVAGERSSTELGSCRGARAAPAFPGPSGLAAGSRVLGQPGSAELVGARLGSAGDPTGLSRAEVCSPFPAIGVTATQRLPAKEGSATADPRSVREGHGGSARHPVSGGWDGAGGLASPLHHPRPGVRDPSESQWWDLNACEPPGGSQPARAAAAFALSGHRVCAERRPDGTERS